MFTYAFVPNNITVLSKPLTETCVLSIGLWLMKRVDTWMLLVATAKQDGSNVAHSFSLKVGTNPWIHHQWSDPATLNIAGNHFIDIVYFLTGVIKYAGMYDVALSQTEIESIETKYTVCNGLAFQGTCNVALSRNLQSYPQPAS